MKHAIIALLALPLAAWAQEEGQGQLERARTAIAEKDQDGDGRLSPEELGLGPNFFRVLDRDGDGFVVAEELAGPGRRRARQDRPDRPDRPRPPEGPEGRPGPRGGDFAKNFLERHDADGDGKLSVDEMPPGGRFPFERADANGDGFLDSGELEALARRGRGPGPQGPGPDGRGGPRQPGQQPDPERVRRMAEGIMQRLDANGDGRITAEEIPEGGRFDLSKADRNGDGAVDLFELTGAMLDRAARGRPGGEGRPEGAGGAQRGALNGELIRRLDSNSDGAIDRAEWDAAPIPLPAQLFERMDGDADGRLTSDEIREALDKADKEGRGGRGRWMARTGEEIMNRLDADGDGKISAAEWKLRPQAFEKLDANGDGFLTRGELAPRGPRRGRPDVGSGKDSAHFLDQHDANGDGQVTAEEFPHERRFAEIDADGDGVLSKQEIEEAMDKRRREEAYDFFERFDLDGDGKVTREEFTGPAAVFEKLDRNHDGVIDAADKLDD